MQTPQLIKDLLRAAEPYRIAGPAFNRRIDETSEWVELACRMGSLSDLGQPTSALYRQLRRAGAIRGLSC